MTCPRCLYDHAETVTAAPEGGAAVWEVRQCPRCWYAWRSTEAPARTSAEHFPAEHRLTPEAIDAAPELPAVPPLLPGVPEPAAAPGEDRGATA
ncbi:MULTISPECIES: non-oxidative hydroxyarylic acid decarboxylases subunit D [Streptomyces]|uniref:4-hydroxybenzoate decarboxylase n=2 Tax=Streptomyces TaxID=1883 RepID=A0A0W7X8P4_9ACTN|nr:MULTISPECIES: non-oxidative hydroxyarylic acid decarboxylases subunit D [Streptomyces]KUF19197.1 hypothetical protein AT728_21840 [Streptomyces silvensis]MVO88536.1 hypothetical protein [Streptomyces typhae]